MATDPDTMTEAVGAPDFALLAAETRALADRVWADATKQVLLRIATSFELLAQGANHNFG